MPAVELVRFVSSGTEATMSALRLARAYTGRAKIIKFAGCYHGHADALLVQAGSGVATLGLPDSPGVHARRHRRHARRRRTTTWPRSSALFDASSPTSRRDHRRAGRRQHGPGAARSPASWPACARLTAAHGALLIFDEVMTGFRVAHGGAQARYGVTPDLTCLGKVIGGGLPVAAYGGRREIMELVAPAGPVYQAGTLSGNPLAMAAGIATLHATGRAGCLRAAASADATALARASTRRPRRPGVPLQAGGGRQHVGLLLPPDSAGHGLTPRAKQADTARYARFFHALLDAGVYLAPSQFEAAFVSTATTPGRWSKPPARRRRHAGRLTPRRKNWGKLIGKLVKIGPILFQPPAL